MSNYGKNFSELLFQAAAELIGVKVVEVGTASDNLSSREINGADVRGAMLTVIDSLRGNWMPDELRPLDEYIDALREYKDFTLAEVAEFLLRVTIIHWSDDGPQMTQQDIASNKWCLSCYQEMIYSFLDILMGHDFELSLLQRVNDLRRRVEESGEMADGEEEEESIPHRGYIH